MLTPISWTELILDRWAMRTRSRDEVKAAFPKREKEGFVGQ